MCVARAQAAVGVCDGKIIHLSFCRSPIANPNYTPRSAASDVGIQKQRKIRTGPFQQPSILISNRRQIVGAGEEFPSKRLLKFVCFCCCWFEIKL